MLRIGQNYSNVDSEHCTGWCKTPNARDGALGSCATLPARNRKVDGSSNKSELQVGIVLGPLLGSRTLTLLRHLRSAKGLSMVY